MINVDEILDLPEQRIMKKMQPRSAIWCVLWCVVLTFNWETSATLPRDTYSSVHARHAIHMYCACDRVACLCMYIEPLLVLLTHSNWRVSNYMLSVLW